MELTQLVIDDKGKIKTIDGVSVNATPVGEPFLAYDGNNDGGNSANFSKMLMARSRYFQKEADAYVRGSDHKDYFCAVQLYKTTKD